ncbi:hypothetical protein [Pseudomonas putida]|uniref:hypothetical protein n=1 Tax=Pseudomonas putida TaxID=303 RepID=UPI001625F5BE|nr:hypothetical protein [Pseudomonas putida]QNG10081.1 hypothetical protein GPM17_17315 [Pseudomonas putida]HDS1057811.1 hypothetical protein [Pseudomonas putida]
MMTQRHPMTAMQRKRLFLTLTLMLDGLPREAREEAYEIRREAKLANDRARRVRRREARKEALQ